MKNAVIFALAACLISGSAAAATPVDPNAAGNLVKNGGFESTSNSGNFQLGLSYGTVDNWTSVGGYNLVFNAATANTVSAASQYSGGREMLWSSTASAFGGKFLALDGDSTVRGIVQQTINGLTVGKTYTLTFDWAAGQLQSRTGDTTEQLQVDFGGQTYQTGIVNNVSNGFTGWTTATTNFTATAANQTLKFMSIGTPNGLPPIATLDNVSLTAAVPEPGTWLTMLLGFGVVGGVMRRRSVKRPQLV